MFNTLSMVVDNPTKTMNFIKYKMKETFFYDHYYKNIIGNKIQGNVKLNEENEKKVLHALLSNGINIVDYAINIEEFQKFLIDADYSRYPHYYAGGKFKNFIEKALEHFLAAKFLELSQDDIYIDIANDNSPSLNIYHELYGCEVYKQDLQFKTDLLQKIIGGNAASLPVENSFCTKMALQCSFEHFEGDSDIRFIKESYRVLKTKGRLCIIPLYLNGEYSIQTNPVVIPKEGIDFESNAKIYCSKGWYNRHGRFYDVNTLKQRILYEKFKTTIFHITNVRDINSECYVDFVLLCEKMA